MIQGFLLEVIFKDEAYADSKNVAEREGEMTEITPIKDEACLFYIRTQCVPRCKHSPLRL
jgi:hypothetical protein